MGRVDDKVAVVTGGASGIGRASCIRLAEEGATVVAADVDVEGGEETAQLVRDAGGEGEFRELDVTSYDQFEELLEEVDDRYGSIDVLFNNAGIGEAHSFEETSLRHRDRIIDVNLKGVWNGCHAVFPYMKAQQGGSIINTSSGAGWMPAPISTYALTKAAVLHLSRSIAQELGQHNIRINALCPGPIETPMTAEWYTPEEREEMRQAVALQRWGQPEEMANCVLFLASDEASFVTGRAFKADGGYG